MSYSPVTGCLPTYLVLISTYCSDLHRRRGQLIPKLECGPSNHNVHAAYSAGQACTQHDAGMRTTSINFLAETAIVIPCRSWYNSCAAATATAKLSLGHLQTLPGACRLRRPRLGPLQSLRRSHAIHRLRKYHCSTVAISRIHSVLAWTRRCRGRRIARNRLEHVVASGDTDPECGLVSRRCMHLGA
jgi:hypothetical protein